jgi:hypothetical protein
MRKIFPAIALFLLSAVPVQAEPSQVEPSGPGTARAKRADILGQSGALPPPAGLLRPLAPVTAAAAAPAPAGIPADSPAEFLNLDIFLAAGDVDAHGLFAVRDIAAVATALPIWLKDQDAGQAASIVTLRPVFYALLFK